MLTNIACQTTRNGVRYPAPRDFYYHKNDKQWIPTDQNIVVYTSPITNPRRYQSGEIVRTPNVALWNWKLTQYYNYINGIETNRYTSGIDVVYHVDNNDTKFPYIYIDTTSDYEVPVNITITIKAVVFDGVELFPKITKTVLWDEIEWFDEHYAVITGLEGNYKFAFGRPFDVDINVMCVHASETST